MKSFQQYIVFKESDEIVNKVASKFHDDWRKSRLKSGTHGALDAMYEPRMKPSGLDDGQEIDIAQHYSKLTPKWQAENKAAAQIAVDLVKNAMQQGAKPEDIKSKLLDRLAAEVHEAWMSRNPKADYNAAQHVPYNSLPEPEKQKDRDHILIAIDSLS